MRQEDGVCACFRSIDGGRYAGLVFEHLDEQGNILIADLKGDFRDGMIFFYQLALGLFNSAGNDVFLCACVNLIVAELVNLACRKTEMFDQVGDVQIRVGIALVDIVDDRGRRILTQTLLFLGNLLDHLID